MRRFRLLALAVAGVVLPVVLVFSAFLFAARSIGEAGAVPAVPQHRVTETEDSEKAGPAEGVEKSGKGGGGAEDRGGRCSEPEHRNDPQCVSETPSEEPDSSGPGSGPEEPEEPDDEPDNSGPGSSNSGKGSGEGGGDD